MSNIERDYAELGVAVRNYASTVAAGGNGLRERREVEAAITMLAIQHRGTVDAAQAVIAVWDEWQNNPVFTFGPLKDALEALRAATPLREQ
jgi:hypothetical protein